MEQIDTILHDSLSKYYKTVTALGEYPYEEVYRVFIGLFIEELINTEAFQVFLTNDDLYSLQKAMYNLYGTTCLIKFPALYNSDDLTKINKADFTPRVTEGNILRTTETSDLRIV